MKEQTWGAFQSSKTFREFRNRKEMRTIQLEIPKIPDGTDIFGKKILQKTVLTCEVVFFLRNFW